ncbi:hypothetical protein H4Q26_016874, partial [Puccinia striiformis f. sp. tritici PST-130]
MAQRVHSLTCRFKGHLYKPFWPGNHRVSSPEIPNLIPVAQPNGSIQGSSQQLSIATLSGSNQGSSKQIQSAQANRAVTSTLTPSQLYEYHQNIQAVDLVAKSREAAKRVAALTIWIELWTKAGSSTLINAEAPNWPLFSLQESQIVLDKCRAGMHGTEDWQFKIQVWNMELFRWVSLAPTCTSKYPPIPRKLLVRLECISDIDCSGLSDAILKMTTDGPYEPLTTPARCILTKSPNLPNFNPSNSELTLPAVPRVDLRTIETSETSKKDTVQAETKSPDSSPLPSPRRIFSNTSKIKWIGSSMASTGSTESPLKNQNSKSTWPDSRVLLGQIIRWYRSFEGKGSPRNAWFEFFGETYDYGYTTVYRVKNWIPLVGEKKLEFD